MEKQNEIPLIFKLLQRIVKVERSAKEQEKIDKRKVPKKKPKYVFEQVIDKLGKGSVYKNPKRKEKKLKSQVKSKKVDPNDNLEFLTE